MFINLIFIQIFVLYNITLSVKATKDSNLNYYVIESLIPRSSFKQLSRADVLDSHELVFAIQQRNMKLLDSMLLERSTPGNELYRKWLSFDELGELINNKESSQVVLDWLSKNDVQVTWISKHETYIRAEATIAQWETLLDTTFYAWEDLSKLGSMKKKDRVIYRSLTYSLPGDIKNHLSTVFNTVQTPPEFKPQYKLKQGNSNIPHKTNLRNPILTTSSSQVNVDFLNKLYKISSNTGNINIQQSVFETNKQEYSTNDLTRFQNKYKLPVQSCEVIGGYEVSECSSTDICSEGNLDVQYIMGIAQVTTTIYWYVGGSDPFVSWILAVSDEQYPPTSNSISWGTTENYYSASSMNTFNSEARNLGLRGVTITVSSGDNGAAGDVSNCDVNSESKTTRWQGKTTWTGKGYFPSFPATSPHVTAVGATMGPETNDPEIACQSQEGGVITTGGGFSTYFATPKWQTAVVKNFFDINTESIQSGYNPNGRGYPDISFIGVNYAVYISGTLYALFGTSASSPVFAAMISLLNAERYLKNEGSLGFLNPTLYSYGYGGTNYQNTSNAFGGLYPFTDVTDGHNKCTAEDNGQYTCCDSGFYAADEWDPTTGMGSITYGNLATMMEIKTAEYINDDNGSGGSSFQKSNSVIWLIFAIIILIFVIIGILGGIGYIIQRYYWKKTSNDAEFPPAEIVDAYFEDVNIEHYIQNDYYETISVPPDSGISYYDDSIRATSTRGNNYYETIALPSSTSSVNNSSYYVGTVVVAPLPISPVSPSTSGSGGTLARPPTSGSIELGAMTQNRI